eukprot:gene271-6686_t
MLKQIVLVVLLLCLASVYSVPVVCGTVTVDAVATLDIDSEADVLSFFKKKSPCKEKGKVCVHYCSNKKGFTFLGRKVYLADFIEKSSGTESAKARAYDQACIKRTMAKKMKNFLYRRLLKNILKKLQQIKATRTKRNIPKFNKAKKHWGKLLNYLETDGSTVEKYFGQMAELSTLFGKVCRNKKNWKRYVRKNLAKFFKGDYKKMIANETNKEIKNLILQKFEKFNKYSDAIFKKNKNHKQMKFVAKFTNKFIKRFGRIIIVTKGDRRYCLCADYARQKGITVSSNIKKVIKNQCKQKYGKYE